jgi:hypothetical protein
MQGPVHLESHPGDLHDQVSRIVVQTYLHRLIISQGIQEMHEASEVLDICVKSNSFLHLTSLRICIYNIFRVSIHPSQTKRLNSLRFPRFFGFKHRIPAKIMFSPRGYDFTVSATFKENGFSTWAR